MGASAGSATFRGVPSSADPGSVVAPNSAFAQGSLLSGATPPKGPQASIAIGKRAGRNGSYANTYFDEKAPGPAPPACPGMDVGAQASEGDSDAAAASTLAEPDSRAAMEVQERPKAPAASSTARQRNAFRVAAKGKLQSLAPSLPIATGMPPKVRKRQPSPSTFATAFRTAAPTNKTI